MVIECRFIEYLKTNFLPVLFFFFLPLTYTNSVISALLTVVPQSPAYEAIFLLFGFPCILFLGIICCYCYCFATGLEFAWWYWIRLTFYRMALRPNGDGVICALPNGCQYVLLPLWSAMLWLEASVQGLGDARCHFRYLSNTCIKKKLSVVLMHSDNITLFFIPF